MLTLLLFQHLLLFSDQPTPVGFRTLNHLLLTPHFYVRFRCGLYSVLLRLHLQTLLGAQLFHLVGVERIVLVRGVHEPLLRLLVAFQALLPTHGCFRLQSYFVEVVVETCEASLKNIPFNFILHLRIRPR